MQVARLSCSTSSHSGSVNFRVARDLLAGLRGICFLHGQLLQFCVLDFGLLQNWNVRVRIFPQRKKILIGRFCLRLITR